MDVFIVFCLAFQVTEALNKLLVFREAKSANMWTLVCTAEDNGDAFVWNTGINTEWQSRTDFKNPHATGSEDKCYQQHTKCPWRYDKTEWIETNWKENPMGPVLDSKWQDFRENDITGTLNTYVHIDTLPNKGAFAFSIRALEDINECNIRLCRDRYYNDASCYGITIQMKVSSTEVTQLIFLQTPSSKNTSNTNEMHLSLTEWRHYILKWDGSNITLYSDKKQLLTDVYFENSTNLKEFNLFHKISNSMYIRYHNYTYLYTKQKNYILDSRWFEFENNNICIQLWIGLCAKCSVRISLRAISGFYYNDTLKIVNGIPATHGLPMWQHVKINMTLLNPEKQKYVIRIISAIKDENNTEGFSAVRNIVKCPPPGTKKIGSILYSVKSKFKNKKNTLPDVACQRISYTDNEVVNANVNAAALKPANDYDCPNGALCSISCNSVYKDFNKTCKNVVICDAKGCTCHTGFTGSNCENMCGDNKYGYMCNKTCGQCLNDKCNYKTGLCKVQLCDNKHAYHIPPYCDIEIQHPPSPKISFVNETSVQAKIISENEYKKTRVQYTFVIKNTNNALVYYQPYETIFQNSTTLEVRKDKLKPGTHYLVSCSLIIENENVVLAGPWTTFRTPCTVSIDSNIDTGMKNLTITANIKKNIPYPCPFDSYNVKIREFGKQKTIQEKQWIEMPLTFKRLEPGTVYEVIVSDEDNTEHLSSTVSTKDGISSPVENVKCSIRNSNSVYIEWERPRKPNGRIKEYEITLNITTYNGCFDLKLPTRPSKFVSDRTPMTNIIFRDLQPYITYTAIVYAWNSNQGEAAFANFSTFSAKIPRSKYINLRKKKKQLLWDPPEDCSIISGPIDATRLEFIGVSKAIKNHTVCETVYENSFDLTRTELYGKEEYEVFVYPVRGIEKIYNISTYVHLKFTTPAKAPPNVRKLEIVEVDTRTNSILLRWQKPFPPNGELDHYKVANCYPKNCTFYVKPVPKNQYCLLWDDYICVTIDQDLSKKFKIAVYAINKNVSKDGEYAYVSYNSSELVSDRPENFTATAYHKKNVVLRWSHPWKTRLALKKYFIQTNVIDTKLRQEIYGKELHENYSYTITKYERTYTKILNLIPSTRYEFRVYAVTIDGNYSEYNQCLFETPVLIAFKGNLSYRFQSDSIICLQIPKITYDTKNSKIYFVVKGNNACEGYVKLNQFLRRHVNVESNEIAWLATNSSTNEYIHKEFCIGDNSTNAVNCPLRKKDFYTVIVIVQADESNQKSSKNEGMISISIQFGDNRYIRRHAEIWAILIVIILIVIAVMIYVYRRRIQKIQCGVIKHKNVSVVYGIKKIVPSTPDLSENNRSLCHTTTDISSQSIETISNDNDPLMPIKVKDFEGYVKNAIKSGLLEKQYETFPRGSTKPCCYGRLPENVSKNRYKNLTAYNETRVVLKKLQDDPFSDYINANYIKGYKMEKRYIATQGPKPNTIVDFWRMVWQEKVLVICMLANVIEHGKIKCEQYWPDVGKKKKYGDVKVFNVKHDVFTDYTFRILEVTYDGETRQVKHLHYTTWPDHGIPMYTHYVATYMRKLLATQIGSGPMIVHCSAGVGRTGTIILCDICLRRAAAKGVVDVFSVTQSIRSQRVNMVDNKQQYLFAHLVIVECLLSLPTSLPCDENLPLGIKDMKESLNKQFQRLEDTTWQDEALRESIGPSFLSERNIAKHRYPELVSNKVGRIYLKRYPKNVEDSDYIAGVYVDGLKIQNQYFASQLPLPSTFSDFWRMIVELKVELIVVLQPPDPDDPTCCSIAPTNDEFKPTPYISVTTKEIVNDKFYVSHKLKLVDKSKKSQTEQSITILSSTKFEAGRNKDPPSVDALVNLWQATLRVPRGDSPTVVLCHDGVSGCGLYLALSFLLERMAIERECDVCLAIRTVKRSRSDFIRSIKQMEYLYDAALTYSEFFETYANFS